MQIPANAARGHRAGDHALLVVLEFVDRPEAAKEKGKGKEKKGTKR
ncbi:MAG: hypothetical protein ACE5JI_04640 [Acidobacteriota bacterium]